MAAALLAGAGLLPSVHAGDAERGRALYEGRVPLAASADTTFAAGCVACHRPSGMGNFEGGIAAPPIAGPVLFRPLDRDTARYFQASAAWRVRPAYDAAALGRLLRTGVAPDGITLASTMPRYTIDADQLEDLSAYLRGLSASTPPGLTADTLRIATITTPAVDPVRRDAMLATLNRFIAQKNGQSRHDAHRSAYTQRTREMATYRKFRVWELEHWALVGEPSTWAAQLDAHQARAPVYAVVAGLGGADWAPVDTFCARQHLPCLLPMVDVGAEQPNFYSLHYHAGIDADARLAARLLKSRGLDRVTLWSASPALAERVTQELAREGVDVVDHGGRAVVSLLAPAEQVQRAAGTSLPLVWLAGTHALTANDLQGALATGTRGWIVTPMRTGEPLDRQLARTREWLRQQRLPDVPLDVAASTLHAATVFGEALSHIDFAFTPEYLLELLEHGLENMVPWSPYPRLAIGPDQRIASKGSWVGEWREGRVDWTWQPTP